MKREETSAEVPARDKQAEEDAWQRHKAERGVWSESMLEALARGLKGKKWFSLIDKLSREKRRGLEGRGRGRDHQRWPNRYFKKLGLFCLLDAREHEITSLRNGVNH